MSERIKRPAQARQFGCCVDRRYGKGCTTGTCMTLPVGKTCGDCVHVDRCVSMFGHTPADTYCDWFPRRFREVPRGGRLKPSRATG